MEVLLASVKSP